MAFDGYGIGCAVCGQEIYVQPRTYDFTTFKSLVFDNRGDEDLVPETLADPTFVDCGLVAIIPFYTLVDPLEDEEIPEEFYTLTPSNYVYSADVQYVPSGTGGMIPVYTNKKYSKTDSYVLKTVPEIKVLLKTLFDEYRQEREIIDITLPDNTTVPGIKENRRILYRGYLGLKNGAYTEFVRRIGDKWVVLNLAQAEVIFKDMAEHFNTCFAANKHLEDIIIPLATSAELIDIFKTYKTLFHEHYNTVAGNYPPGVPEPVDPEDPEDPPAPVNPNPPVFSAYTLDEAEVILGALTYTHPQSVALASFKYEILDNTDAVVHTSEVFTNQAVLETTIDLMSLFVITPEAAYKFRFTVTDANGNSANAVIFTYTAPVSAPIVPTITGFDGTTNTLAYTISAYSHPYNVALKSIDVRIYETDIETVAASATETTVGAKTFDTNDAAIVPALVNGTTYNLVVRFVDNNDVVSTWSSAQTFTKVA